jgi:hypothetical protein
VLDHSTLSVDESAAELERIIREKK